MRICHFISSKSFAGIEQYVDEISQQQSKDKEVIIICDRKILCKFNKKNVSLLSFSSLGRNSPIGQIRLAFLLRQINPDVIFSHASKPTIMINRIKRLFNFKHIAYLHGIKHNIKHFQKADLIIAGSNQSISSLKGSNFKVIHNWALEPKNYSSSSRKEYFLSVGRLVEEKGFDLLIDTWKEVNDRLIIIGDGPLRKALQTQIKKTNQENKIIISPSVSKQDLDEIYGKAKMLIISSRREGGPRVALEALIRGIKVISTDVGHMNLVLEKEFLCRRNDLYALKKLVSESIESYEKIDQSEAFSKVKRNFTIENANQQISDAINSLII